MVNGFLTPLTCKTQLADFKIIKEEQNHVISTDQIYISAINAKMWVFGLTK
jgi:hypothetical protein